MPESDWPPKRIWAQPRFHKEDGYLIGTITDKPHENFTEYVRADLRRVFSTHDVEHLSEIAHDAYEAAATEHGWITNEASRVPWSEVPTRNKATTRAAVSAVLYALAERDRDNKIKEATDVDSRKG